MSQIEITFPDGSVRSVASGTTGLEIAKGISEGLARKALGVKLGNKVLDLSRPLTESGTIKIITPNNDDPDALMLLRHSCSHVLAEAICDLFPGTKLAYGPAIEKGFYYDLMTPTPIKEEDFPKIEKRMKEIIKEDRPFTRIEVSGEEGLKRTEGDKYKTDNAERALARENSDGTLSFYVTGEPGKNWEDLCAGPHVPSTGKLKSFKILSLSGAYWHGDQKSDQLTRVYGTCFADKEGLEIYVKQLEEAAKRDHRKIGKEMDLYHIEDHSPGMVFWHPKGTKMVNALKDYIRGENRQSRLPGSDYAGNREQGFVVEIRARRQIQRKYVQNYGGRRGDGGEADELPLPYFDFQFPASQLAGFADAPCGIWQVSSLRTRRNHARFDARPRICSG